MALVRLVVFLLLLPLATSGTLPAWARLASEPTHVCRCSVEKHDCVCVRCHPDRPDFLTSEESVKGRCGDDEHAITGTKVPFLLTAPTSIFAAAFVLEPPIQEEERVEDVIMRPPTPPPRA